MKPVLDDVAMEDVLEDIAMERVSQVAKWGVQNHPDLKPDDPGVVFRSARAAYAKAHCDRHVKAGTLSWHSILKEELAEAVEQAALQDVQKLREELVQCAAVCVAWIEDIDRRST